MKKRVQLLNILAAAAVLAGAGCGLVPVDMRYRVTVEVDTPQGLSTGSSVWEVSSSDGIGFPGPEAGGVSTKITGEAVAVDLPGGTLFALLAGPHADVGYPEFVVQRHIAADPNASVDVNSRDWRENEQNIIESRVVFDLSPSEYPMLIRFRNISDPTSVEKVEPENLSAQFGRGTTLRRIRIEITNDKPTTASILERLSWLEGLREGGGVMGSAPRDRQRPEHNLSWVHFIQGA